MEAGIQKGRRAEKHSLQTVVKTQEIRTQLHKLQIRILHRCTQRDV